MQKTSTSIYPAFKYPEPYTIKFKVRKTLKQVIKFTSGEVKLAIGHAFVGLPDYEKQPKGACPICKQTLKTLNFSDTTGVMIDRCPQGHGVWFDMGELEKAQILKEKGVQSEAQILAEWAELIGSAGKDNVKRKLPSSSLWFISSMFDKFKK